MWPNWTPKGSCFLFFLQPGLALELLQCCQGNPVAISQWYSRQGQDSVVFTSQHILAFSITKGDICECLETADEHLRP